MRIKLALNVPPPSRPADNYRFRSPVSIRVFAEFLAAAISALSAPFFLLTEDDERELKGLVASNDSK